MAKNTNRLKVLRAEKGLSQLDTSIEAKIPTHRYWLIENGYREPTDRERAVLARVFNVDDVFLTPAVASSGPVSGSTEAAS